MQHLMNTIEQPPPETGRGAAHLSAHRGRILVAALVAIAVVTVVLIVYRQATPGMRLKGDGFTKVRTVQGYEVWTKVSGDRIQVHLVGDGGDLCPGSGSFSPNNGPLCADESDGWSAFLQVLPVGAPATVVTLDGRQMPLAVVTEPGWPYALAVRVAHDDSLFGARLK
jgi:hypothetical protein